MIVNAEKAIELVYDLLLSRQWLVTKAEKLPIDPLSENEAVMFLYTLDQQTETSWLRLTPEQRATANGLIMDFIAKCLTSTKQWLVSDNITPDLQAIEIIKHEIFLSHNSLVMPN